MSAPPETVSEVDPQPRPTRKKARWVDWVLFIGGFACLVVFATQTIRYYRAKNQLPAVPTGQIMSGLEETDRIPLTSGDAAGFNVLVLTMDTTRADHLGCYGHRGVQTPNIDGLARNGVLFAEAFTPSPSTLPGHGSILTGLYPYNHGARANGTFKLNPEASTLAEILKKEGYATGAVISAYVLDARFGLDQGFDVYHDDLTKGVKHGTHMFRERPAEFTNEAAAEWLDANADSRFFLWVHYFDPHAPYAPPEPFRSQYEHRPYDGEIAYVDSQIGMLLKKLDDLGVREKTIVVLAGDHGEGLGEHGENTHSMLVYDATVHTPLIISAPALFAEGHVVYSQVSNVDIVPTILDVLGFTPPVEFDGTSLLRAIEQRPKGIYLETICTLVLHGWAPLFGIRHSEGKYIHAPTPEYYDLSRDPQELNNVLDKRLEEVAAFSQELDQHIGSDRFGEDALAQAAAMDQETAQGLRALGYAGGVADPGSVDAHAAAQFDPKDMVFHWEEVQKANNLTAVGRLHEAREIFERCVERVPGDVWALYGLAEVYATMGREEEALEILLRALELEKNDPGTYVRIGRAYLGRRRFAEAREQFEAAGRVDPNFAPTLLGFAALAAAENRIEEAVAFYKQAIEMDPGTTGPTAYAELGFLYTRLLRHEEARECFHNAIELDALNSSAHAGLGHLLVAENEFDEAAREFAIALRFNPNQPIALANLAALHDRKKEFGVAKSCAERALSINENFAPALNALGLIMKHMGDIDEAMELFNRVLESEPANLACRINLALCYMARRESEKAAEQYEEVLKYNPYVTSALANLATYHFTHGRRALARELLMRALRADPNYAVAHRNFGSLLAQEGNFRESLFHLKRSFELDPDQEAREELEYQIDALELELSATTRPTERAPAGPDAP